MDAEARSHLWILLTCTFSGPSFWNSLWSLALWRLYMFLSSLFSILCLFALLPERVPQLYSSSLPSSCYKFPRAHFFGNVLFFVVACVCLVITYLPEDIKFVFNFLPVCSLSFHGCFFCSFWPLPQMSSNPGLGSSVQLKSRLEAQSMGRGRGTGCDFDPQGAICWKPWKPGSSGLFLLGW